MRKAQLGLAMLLSMFLIISCSDDDETKKDTGTSDGTVTQQDGTTQEDGTTTQEDGTTTQEDGTTAQGACTNTADAALLATAEDRDAVTAQATTCATQCLAQQAEDLGACSADCLATASGLTAECSACYGGVVICSIGNCAACLPPNDPTAEECVSCQETNCLPDFYTCSGLPSGN